MFLFIIMMLFFALSFKVSRHFFKAFIACFIIGSLSLMLSPLIALSIDSYADKQDNRVNHVLEGSIKSKQGISYALTVASQANAMIDKYNALNDSPLKGLIMPLKHKAFNVDKLKEIKQNESL